jgi:DNA-binding transcriptional MocR family regulator
VLRELLAERPALALAAMARLGELLAALTTEVEELRSCDLDQRLLACLRRHARTRRELYLTHAELAAQVGASRANVSRALARLRRRGAVQCGRRRNHPRRPRRPRTGGGRTRTIGSRVCPPAEKPYMPTLSSASSAPNRRSCPTASMAREASPSRRCQLSGPGVLWSW